MNNQTKKVRKLIKEIKILTKECEKLIKKQQRDNKRCT